MKEEVPAKPVYGQFVEAEGVLADQLRFLALAVSDDSTRYFMCRIEVEEVEPATEERKYPILRGISTDGRRMHIIEPLAPSAVLVCGMSPGGWHVVAKNSKRVQLAKYNEPSGKFPNWSKVVPDGQPEYKTEFTGVSLKGSDLYRHTPDLLRLFRSFPEPTAINLQYLADLGLGRDWKVDWYAPNRAIVFTSGVFKSVIMPMEAG